MNEFIDKIGVNTHIDFAFKGSPYLNYDNVVKAIKYLGVRHLRDGAGKIDTCKKWVSIRNDISSAAKRLLFCAYLPNGSPEFVIKTFAFLPQLYRNGLIDVFEAPNEPDKPYSINLGNGIEWTVDFTNEVLTHYVHPLNKKLINISVGSGWTADDKWQGNYDALPDMTKSCDFANPHTYPNVGQDVLVSIKRLNDLARKSMPDKPIIITELGWDLRDGHKPEAIAADIITAVRSKLAERIYIYALFDDESGKFGLFENDATPRPAATAIRKLLGA